jgi:hypothetical protein
MGKRDEKEVPEARVRIRCEATCIRLQHDYFVVASGLRRRERKIREWGPARTSADVGQAMISFIENARKY